MKIARGICLNRAFAGVAAAALLAVGQAGAAPKSQKPLKAVSSREAFDIAVEAYIFGYPLVTMGMTRRMITNVREPDGMRAPMGQFARIRSLPLASSRDATMPNADTLYTGVWLDVSREPWVLSLPHAGDRYCLFSLIDGWTTVFATPSGDRKSATGPRQFVITGPGWKGKLPAGMKAYESPTGIVWALGRMYCAGTSEDYAAVRVLQDQYSAVPLSAYGKPYSPVPGHVDPPIDMQRSAREQVNGLGAANYFNYLALLMKDNPPVSADRRIIKRMARLGIVPGQPFDIGRLAPAIIEVFQYVPNAAIGKVTQWLKEGEKNHDWTFQDGWMRTLKIGTYGTDYTQRALIAALGLGAGRAQDILVAASSEDGAGQAYNGNYPYVMHFAPGQIPSASRFWSLTLYGADYFFVSNPLCRYSLGARDQLKLNADGSLDLHIQKHAPGADREANWLPAPEGKFMLMLRVYAPEESLLKGSWKIPPVKRAG